MRHHRGRMFAATCAVSLVVAGCANAKVSSPPGHPDQSRSGGPVSTTANDPALTSAAERVDHVVHPRYDRWYAGLVLDHAARTMTVYRKPGSDLDQAVSAQVTSVRVIFKAARLSEKEMLALASRIMTDAPYWKSNGIIVNGAGPLPDGSAVRVMTGSGTNAESVRMSRHYGSPIVVERGSAVPAPGSRFTPTPSDARPS